MKDVNLRRVFDAFCEHYAPARELMRTGTLEGDLKGAPLRCSLAGARFSRPGLLVTGEAAGSTYSFTGEGIGKAYETGLLAAEALLGATPRAASRPARRRGAHALRGRPRALQPRFDLYERANHVNAHPWLADLVIWRANRSARLLRAHGRRARGDQQPGQPGQRARLLQGVLPGQLTRAPHTEDRHAPSA